MQSIIHVYVSTYMHRVKIYKLTKKSERLYSRMLSLGDGKNELLL